MAKDGHDYLEILNHRRRDMIAMGIFFFATDVVAPHERIIPSTPAQPSLSGSDRPLQVPCIDLTNLQDIWET